MCINNEKEVPLMYFSTIRPSLAYRPIRFRRGERVAAMNESGTSTSAPADLRGQLQSRRPAVNQTGYQKRHRLDDSPTNTSDASKSTKTSWATEISRTGRSDKNGQPSRLREKGRPNQPSHSNERSRREPEGALVCRGHRHHGVQRV